MSKIPSFILLRTKSLAHQQRDDVGVPVTWNVEITGNSIDFEKPFHSASLFLVNILDDSFELVLIFHVTIIVTLVFRNGVFKKIVLHVHKMDF